MSTLHGGPPDVVEGSTWCLHVQPRGTVSVAVTSPLIPIPRAQPPMRLPRPLVSS